MADLLASRTVPVIFPRASCARSETAKSESVTTKAAQRINVNGAHKPAFFVVAEFMFFSSR
jgi:hypothetical protein